MTAADDGGDDDDDDDDSDDRGADFAFGIVELPDWLEFDDDDTIAGTPGADDVGSHFVALIVRRRGEVGAQTFTIVVNDVVPSNSPPRLDREIAPDPQNAIEGEPFSFAVRGFFSDPDGDPLAFSAGGLPGGLAIGANGTIAGAPAAGTAAGSPFDVTVSASDGEAAASGSFSLVVTAANRPPVLDGQIEPDPQQATEGRSFDFDVGRFFSDPDHDPLSFTADGLPAGLSIDDGRISGTPAAGTAAGSPFGVTVRASDGSAAAADTFTLIVVAAANRPPTLERPISPDPQTVMEGEAYSFDAGPFFSDPDGDTLAFSAAGLPPGLAIEAASGVVSGTPGVNDEAATAYTIAVTASDGAGSASDSFTLNVASIDRPPTLPDPPPALSTTEDTPLTVTPALLGAVDEAPSSLTVVLTAPAGSASFTVDGATLRPAQDFNGTLTVEALVRDANAASNSVRLTVTVVPENDPPRIGPIDRQTATEASPFTLNLGEHVADVEGDPLRFSAEGLPPGLAIDEVLGVISGTPPAGTEAREHTVRLTVDDGSADTSANIVIAVIRAGRTDLAAEVSVAPNPVPVGAAATWMVTVRNNASVDVGNVALEAVFSGGAPFLIDPVTDAACSLEALAAETRLSCRFAPLAAGSSRDVTVTGSGSGAGDVRAVATVSIADPVPLDETPDNNEASAALSVAESLGDGPAQTLAVPGARGLAAGDYDGDGVDDLAVATGGEEPTWVFLNALAGEGTTRRSFASVPISAGEPSAALSIAAADLDGDADLDLVVANAVGADHVLLNAGQASFTTVALELSDGASNAVEIADVDGDALPDLVFANDGSSSVYVNSGGGRFALFAGLPGSSADVAAADLVGDALPELVFANRDGNATIYGLAGQSFALVTTLDTGPASSVEAVDLDATGGLDLVFARGAAGTAPASDLVYLNTSAGSAASFSLAAELGVSATVDLVTGDFDADGRNDVVALSPFGGHRLYTNSGAAPGTAFVLHPQQFASAGALAAALGKFNPDGRFDLAIAGGDAISVFVNDGHGNLGKGDTGAPTLSLIGEPAVTVTVGEAYADAGATASDDVDGDLTAAIVVDNPVNSSVIGTYTVTYDVADSSGNPATALTRTVTVRARGASGGGGGGAFAAEVVLLLLLACAGKGIGARFPRRAHWRKSASPPFPFRSRIH